MGDDPVCKIYQGDELIYPQQPPKGFLKVKNLQPYQNNNLTLTNWTGKKIKFRTNQMSVWDEVEILHDNYILTIPPGGYILLDGSENTIEYGWKMSCNRSWEIEGDFSSLYSGDTIPEVAFGYFFAGDTNLKDAGGLILPAVTARRSCEYMFQGCTSLTTAPQLPARELTRYCYQDMFYGCTSLTTAPVLPATTLAIGCYRGMFTGCISLTTAPELPATTLIQSCYNGMFSNCTSLMQVKCLATDISATYCTDYWVYETAPTGTFYCAPGMENTWTRGDDGVPTGWTITPYTE